MDYICPCEKMYLQENLLLFEKFIGYTLEKYFISFFFPVSVKIILSWKFLIKRNLSQKSGGFGWLDLAGLFETCVESFIICLASLGMSHYSVEKSYSRIQYHKLKCFQSKCSIRSI